MPLDAYDCVPALPEAVSFTVLGVTDPVLALADSVTLAKYKYFIFSVGPNVRFNLNE
jgi:hypothetical protein